MKIIKPILTSDELFRTYSQEELYKVMIGEYPNLTKKYTSPFRNDNEPSCYFRWNNNQLYFVDWADRTRNVVGFAIDLYSLQGIDQAIYKLNKLMNEVEEVSILPRIQYIEKKKNERKLIEIVPRNWDERDRNFWIQYGITKDQLEEDSVSPVKYVIVNKKNVYSPFDITYDYLVNNIEDIHKVYRPFAKEYKWICNTSKDNIGSLDKLDYTKDSLIITKSYKDCRVVRNFGYNAIWLQSENQFPNIHLLFSVLRNFKYIYILFDNDGPGDKGVVAFNKYIRNTNIPFICILRSPDPLSKDISDMYKNNGKDFVQQWIDSSMSHGYHI